jgi:hypothetical protein
MTAFHRACLKCGYPAESPSPQCAECGFAVPIDLLVLSGTMTHWHLSRRRLIVGAMLRAACGLLIVLIAVGLIVIFMYATSWTNRSGKPLASSQLAATVFAYAIFGLVGVAGLWLLARLPSRLRAIMSPGAKPQNLRWAWTEARFWRDASDFPNDGESWDRFHEVEITRNRDSICVSLRGSRRPTIWLLGTDEDAEVIRSELSRHLNASARSSP